MKAWAVIGANYGDEGKGKMVDYLCHEHGADLVVRFNGGAQAGHTVVTPEGLRHVFHHFGSGSFLGTPTYLSRFFVCNPILFNREWDELRAKLDHDPCIYVDPTCLVTTPWDMVINQAVERMRGDKRHGSCGVGFNETIERSAGDIFDLRVGDLFNHNRRNSIIEMIDKEWIPYRLDQLGIDRRQLLPYLDDFNEIYSTWCMDAGLFCGRTIGKVGLLNKTGKGKIVFEGAQGLLLDQHNKEGFPHLTRSNTGAKNVAELAKEWGIEELEAIYCTRTYLTRHGAGPLPHEFKGLGEENGVLGWPDDTNIPHEFQGTLRYALLDFPSLIKRCADDAHANKVLARIAFSHTDQVSLSTEFERYAHYTSNGPTRNHVACIDSTG